MAQKRYKLRFLPLFEHDLAAITEYIVYRLRDPNAAARLIDAVEAAIMKRLPAAESFEPYHGARERENPYYRIGVGNYMIFYVVLDDVMEVRRILYSRRNIRSHLR